MSTSTEREREGERERENEIGCAGEKRQSELFIRLSVMNENIVKIMLTTSMDLHLPCSMQYTQYLI